MPNLVKQLRSSEVTLWIREHPEAVILDVRTPEEWESVGRPIHPQGGKAIFLSWRLGPSMERSASFEADCEEALSGFSKDTPILWLCRGGHRSYEAAMAMASRGWSGGWNVVDGYEGHGVPGAPGWKKEGLPWK